MSDFNFNEVVIDRVHRIHEYDLNGKRLWTMNQVKDFKLTLGGETVYAQDAQGVNIMAFDKSKTAEADWSNALMHLGALAEQIGSKKEVASSEAKQVFTTVEYLTSADGKKLTLTHTPKAAVANTDCADLIDIEFFTAGNDIRELIDNAHSSGVVVVCSSHDFQKTPDKNELISRMVKMQQVGADFPKVAVMPHDSTDVLTLLAATVDMKNKYFATPIITISMGKLGIVSRLCGELFGSAMTFASAGDSSAPGQIGLDVVNAVLDSIAE